MRLTNNIFDRWIFWLVMLLAILPFGQILHIRLPGVTLNAFELIWLLLLGVLLLKIIYGQKMKGTLLSFIFPCVALIYIILSAVIYDVSIKEATVQFRSYLPFVVALMLITTGTSIPVVSWVKGLIIAAGLSGFAALYIHYLTPHVIESVFSENEEVQAIVLRHGRLYWTNASLAFFVLLSLFCKEFKVVKWVVLLSFILSFAAMFNTLNRTMLVGYSLFCLFAILTAGSFQIYLKRSFIILVIGCSVIIIGIGISAFDERVYSLIELRFFGRGDIVEVYRKSIVIERLSIYEQYLQNIFQNYPLGQGLGRPFSSLDGNEIYTTDISFMSFLLPFGVMGLLIFGLFIYTIFAYISQKNSSISIETKKLLVLFLSIFLLMSLNLDFFSRNNFVIYLVVLVVSLRVPLNNKDRIELKNSSV